MTFHLNPKIYLGIHLCATYIKLRPGTLLKAREKHIDIKLGGIVIPHPKQKNKPQIIWLEPDDIKLIESIPRGLPDLYYFRHTKGMKGCTAGKRFGNKYFYKWWIKACNELGVSGVDLYGGTRHTTTTAMGEFFSKEDLRSATGNVSKAFERYFQADRSKAQKVSAKIKEITSNQRIINGKKVVDLKQHSENTNK